MLKDLFEQLVLSSSEELIEVIGLKQELLLADFVDKSLLQNGFCFRSRRLGKRVANALVDDKGLIDMNLLATLLKILQNRVEIAPTFVDDTPILNHIHYVLSSLGEKKFLDLFYKIGAPLCNAGAEELIRDTLLLKKEEKVRDYHIRRAVLSALLTPLRQSVGSCFATAPAILVQISDLFGLLSDLNELLSVGKLKNLVPLNLNWGSGDLRKPLLSTIALKDIAKSPSLISGLEALSVIDKKLGYQQKIAFAENCVLKALEGDPKILVEGFFRKILLEKMKISEKEIQAATRLSKTQAILQTRGGPITYDLSFARVKKAEDFLFLEKEAQKAFKATTENALLRAWEYTLASFCDIRKDFSAWNLFVGLGFNFEEADGFAHFLYLLIQEKLDLCNADMKRFQEEAVRASNELQSYSALLNRADGESYQREARNKSVELESFIRLRDDSSKKGEQYVHLFSYLMKQYSEKIKDYFQEVYDADIRESAKFYEDSPAGFRLVYKNLHLDPKNWTFIQNEEQYTECLRAFFSSVERDIISECSLDKVKESISEITTALIGFIQSKRFLKASFQRIEKLKRRSPWAYTSGGGIKNLLEAYFKEPRQTVSKNISSPMELFQFLKTNPFEKTTLISSPTHAFVLYPNRLAEFDVEKAIEETKEMASSMSLSGEEQLFLLKELKKKHPFISYKSEDFVSLKAFRDGLLKSVDRSVVDGALFRLLPLHTAEEISRLDIEVPDLKEGIFSSEDLEMVLKESILSSNKKIFYRDDFSLLKKMAENKLSFPKPFIFADSNWSNLDFGFVAGPFSFELELWCFEKNSRVGTPLISDWFDKEATWNLYL